MLPSVMPLLVVAVVVLAQVAAGGSLDVAPPPDAPLSVVSSSFCIAVEVSLQLPTVAPPSLQAVASQWVTAVSTNASLSMPSSSSAATSSSLLLGGTVAALTSGGVAFATAYPLPEALRTARLLERAVALDVLRAVASDPDTTASSCAVAADLTALTLVSALAFTARLTACVDYTSSSSASVAATWAADVARLQTAVLYGNSSVLFNSGMMLHTAAWSIAALGSATYMTAAASAALSNVTVSATAVPSSPTTTLFRVQRLVYVLDGHDGAGPAWGPTDWTPALLALLGTELRTLPRFAAGATTGVTATAAVAPDFATPTLSGAVLSARCVVTVVITAPTQAALQSIIDVVAGQRFSLPLTSSALAASIRATPLTTPVVVIVPQTVSAVTGSGDSGSGGGGSGACTSLACLVPVVLWSSFGGIVLMLLCVMCAGKALTADELHVHRDVELYPTTKTTRKAKMAPTAVQRRVVPTQQPAIRRTGPYDDDDDDDDEDDVRYGGVVVPSRGARAQRPTPYYQQQQQQQQQQRSNAAVAVRRSATVVGMGGGGRYQAQAQGPVNRTAVTSAATSRHRAGSSHHRNGSHAPPASAAPPPKNGAAATAAGRSGAHLHSTGLEGVGTMASSGTFEYASDLGGAARRPSASAAAATAAATPGAASAVDTRRAATTPSTPAAAVSMPNTNPGSSRATSPTTGAGARPAAFEI